jgi:hypothetical protein
MKKVSAKEALAVKASSSGPNQNDVPASERGCLAHGCPQLGTITSSVSHSHAAEWFCRFHHGKKPEQWGEITRKLRMGVDPFKPEPVGA